MDTRTEQLTVAWYLKEKHEMVGAVDLSFERAEWWTGDNDDNFQDVEPGTPGAGTLPDKGMGVMTLHLTPEQAASFEVGRQYAFKSDVTPLYEGE